MLINYIQPPLPINYNQPPWPWPRHIVSKPIDDMFRVFDRWGIIYDGGRYSEEEARSRALARNESTYQNHLWRHVFDLKG